MAASAEVLIIGGGPAGLATALGLSRQLIKCIVFDSGVYRNSRVKHMHNVQTWDHQNPADYRAAARKELLTRYQTTSFVDRKVETVRKLENGTFQAVDSQGTTYTGKKLVLASGIRDVLPEIDGYDECWGTGIIHCLFCHGFEERGAAEVGIFAQGPMLSQPQLAMTIGGMAKRLADTVTIFTNGDENIASQLVEAKAEQRGFAINTQRIKRFAKPLGHDTGVIVHLEDGTTKTLGFMVHAPQMEMPSPWQSQLGLEVDPMCFYKTQNMFNEANVPGVFVAGDCAVMAKAVTAATWTGAGVAAGVAHQLAAQL